jgi:hypothetical protein
MAALGIELRRQGQVLQIVLAVQRSGALSRRLNGWQQQADQDADDGDDHQQLDERKTKGREERGEGRAEYSGGTFIGIQESNTTLIV